MKKIISLCLVICLGLSFSSIAFAAEVDEPEIFKKDIYITYIDINLYDQIDVESIDYVSIYNESKEGVSVQNKNSSVNVNKLSKEEVKIKYKKKDPIIATALQRIAETEESGLMVKSMNIILPQNNNGMSVMSDADYWRSNTTYWGSYLGQEFRYYFSTLSVGTGLVNAKSTPSKWSDILPAAVRIVIDRLIGTTKLDTVYGIINDVSTVIGAAATPVNVYFDSTKEYVKGESKGTLSEKHIVVQDINNKIQGHSFYPWGSVAHLSYQDRMEVKYFEGIKNGAPSYPVKTTPYSSAKIVTSTNYNNTGVLFPKVREYYNYVGYQCYYEYVQMNMNPSF